MSHLLHVCITNLCDDKCGHTLRWNIICRTIQVKVKAQLLYNELRKLNLNVKLDQR